MDGGEEELRLRRGVGVREVGEVVWNDFHLETREVLNVLGIVQVVGC